MTISMISFLLYHKWYPCTWMTQFVIYSPPLLSSFSFPSLSPCYVFYWMPHTPCPMPHLHNLLLYWPGSFEVEVACALVDACNGIYGICRSPPFLFPLELSQCADLPASPPSISAERIDSQTYSYQSSHSRLITVQFLVHPILSHTYPIWPLIMHPCLRNSSFPPLVYPI